MGITVRELVKYDGNCIVSPSITYFWRVICHSVYIIKLLFVRHSQHKEREFFLIILSMNIITWTIVLESCLYNVLKSVFASSCSGSGWQATVNYFLRQCFSHNYSCVFFWFFLIIFILIDVNWLNCTR